MYRQLTSTEEELFRNEYGWLSLFWIDKGEGKYFYSENLQSTILVFKKTDGNLIFTLVDKDYSKEDPSKTAYIVEETLRAIKDNTQSTFSGISSGFKISIPILVLIIIILFRNELKDLLKGV